jgi:hypothetical protein
MLDECQPRQQRVFWSIRGGMRPAWPDREKILYLSFFKVGFSGHR